MIISYKEIIINHAIIYHFLKWVPFFFSFFFFLSCQLYNHRKTAGYQVEEIKKPTIYRLTISGENTSEREEAVFIVHGILIDKDLPPVIVTKLVFFPVYFLTIFTIFYIFISQTRNDQGRIQKFAAIARQYIALTGLNLDLFDDALEGLARVHRFFEDSLPPNSIESFQLPTIEGSSVLASHTRYFTPRRNSLSLILENFGPGVDPNGVLEYLKGSNFVHTEDNVVQYLGEKESKNGTSCVINFEIMLTMKFTNSNFKVITILIPLAFREEILSK